jgi:hypothetical protein
MASTYTANQGIEKMDTGDQSGTWGGTVNTNMDIIDRAISGVGALTLTGSTTTLTTTDGTLTDGMYRVLVLGDGGDLGSDNTITLSPNDQDKAYLVYNNLSANRNAIFTQGTGANATVENGETAWIYADGGGSGAIVRTAVSSTKLLDQDGDTGIRVEEGGDDDDTIRFDIAGAEDFTMTANTFTALSGSDIAIASGATITNSGTATGFGADAERAFAGVLQTNANFVDQVIFGPAVDGMAWNGLWNKASVFSSLMLATIEDEGSNTEINIWDLTEQSSAAPSTTPLATVDLSADATPTSIAACMGYLIVGSEDGISIIDPHSGAWAERTAGWPRSLSTSTAPALAANTVNAVGAGLAKQPALDPRTGGPLPTFAASYSGGSQAFSVIKDDGNVWDRTGTGHNSVVSDGRLIVNLASVLYIATDIDSITADTPSLAEVGQAGSANNLGFASDVDDGVSVAGNDLAYASTAGLTRSILNENTVANGTGIFPVNALITRAYNTGFLASVTKAAWLANSTTADRSAFSNTLTEVGSVTEAVVETSAELKGYSGWSSSNYLHATSADADFEMGTDAFHYSYWYKTAGVSGTDVPVYYRNSATGATPQWGAYFTSTTVVATVNSTTADATATYTDSSTFDDKWHKHDVNWSGATGIVDSYIDGVLVATATNASVTSVSGGTNYRVTIGDTPEAGGYNWAGSLSLVRISKTTPTATQIRQMYDGEKGLFVASAKALLGSTSTDAVLDVDVDPLTKKVIVTQTDKINIFDGLVNVEQPAVNSGNSEKGKLWGDLRAEQNSANAYVTAPATDQRQVNEMVRGLANDMPGGVDLSKAKAWCKWNQSTHAILASYNIESLEDVGVGKTILHFGIPFKSANYVAVAANQTWDNRAYPAAIESGLVYVYSRDDDANYSDIDPCYVVCFGELENE